MLRAHLPCHASSSGRCHVYVYRGEGAGWRSVRSTFESLQRLLPKQYEVSTLTAAELVDGSWTAEAALLVMPGGADLPYCNRLNGKGNSIIQGFVRAGGSYLGLCAGAYYASSCVQFEQGSRLQVLGYRELGFFPGIACGAAYPGFDYQTEAGAVAADVQFAVPPALAQQLQQQQGSTPLQEHCSSSSWCFTHDYSNGVEAGQVKVCEDVRLEQHTEALRRVLAASQEQRDLFLSCLLYEVLRRA
ncbi:hypothetical protein OEZ86_000573 [Tetradesmus obliquus]|nr:hypothetical protein OEZ86_000573 [Tetradesmus obliquus]